MKRSSLGHFPCSVARTLDVVGEWWTPMILRDIFYGARRFELILGDLGISRNILTDRLNTLTANGIVEQQQYCERPPRFEYRLTERGSELVSMLLALMEWGDKWLPAGHDGEYALAVHKDCGHRVRNELRCVQCGEVPSNEVRFRPGPGNQCTSHGPAVQETSPQTAANGTAAKEMANRGTAVQGLPSQCTPSHGPVSQGTAGRSEVAEA